MKKTVSCIIIAFVVLMMGSVQAEGLLPSLSETVGIAMPSLGEALQRYPDSETENEDGSVTERYTNVSETDFNTFSVYLEKQEAELADYHVEGNVLTAEIRVKGKFFSLNYDSKNTEAKVTYPSGTFDEWMKSAKTHFEAGQKLLEEGKTDEALMEFLAIPQYNEYTSVAELLQNNENLATAFSAARKAQFTQYLKQGNTIAFGRYEQDKNTENGPEEIEWIMLDYDEKEDKVLLLSKYGLDVKPYDNTEGKDITWEECSLRKWLNSEFLQSAFSDEECAAISLTMVDNSSTQGYSGWNTNGGNNTEDYVFLLSVSEAIRFYNISEKDRDNVIARIAPTDYAKAQGAWTYEKKTKEGKMAGVYWLRSPGGQQHEVAIVDSPGNLSNVRADYYKATIRPAIWLNLRGYQLITYK